MAATSVAKGDGNDTGQKKSRTSDSTISQEKLGKRLAYILRYGALQEGLEVDENGFVEMSGLLNTHLMRHHTESQVVEEVEKSVSYRGGKRFQIKSVNGQVLVRATNGRNFERSPYHQGTNVPTLFESCVNVIATNIRDYDLQDFWDEHLLLSLIRKLKKQKRLNNTALRNILGPTIEHLDMRDVYITEATIKLIGERCPHLKFLSLKDSGFVMTDHLMQLLLKKLERLEILNLTGCKDITGKTLDHLLKYNKNLKRLNICDLQLISQEAIVHFMTSAPSLLQLDIFFNRNIKKEMIEVVEEIARQRNISLVLKGLTNSNVTPSNGAGSLSHFALKDG